HQSSILSTDYRSDLTRVAVAMFAIWCQEIFFKYMRQHYNLDRLIKYQTEPIPDTTRVINLPGASSTARSAAKTDYLTVNCSNSHKSSCPKKWSPNKSKPISARRVNCSRPLKNAAPKSSNLKLNAKRLPNTSRSKISLSKIALVGCVQRKNTSSTLSSSSLIGLKQPSPSLPARSSNASMMPAH